MHGRNVFRLPQVCRHAGPLRGAQCKSPMHNCELLLTALQGPAPPSREEYSGCHVHRHACNRLDGAGNRCATGLGESSARS